MNGSYNKNRERIRKEFCLHNSSEIVQAKTRCGWQLCLFHHWLWSVKFAESSCGTKVIMSGCRDDNPDDERREAARSNTKSVSRGTDSGGGRGSDRSQRAAVLPDQS